MDLKWKFEIHLTNYDSYHLRVQRNVIHFWWPWWHERFSLLKFFRSLKVRK